MRLTLLPSKHYKYLHPSYRSKLLRAQRDKKRKRIVKRNALQLIRRKYRLADIQPRIPPLHCARCGLSTRSLPLITLHDCTLKNIYYWRGTGAGACAELNTLGDDEIDEDLLALGGRNRMRDGMGILERFAHPQHVTMYEFNISEGETTESFIREVPTLSSLAMEYYVTLSTPPSSSLPSTSIEDAFEMKEMQIVSKKPIGKAPLHGHLCLPCGRAFASFNDYDVHLEEKKDKRGRETNKCRRRVPQPLPVMLNDSGNVPVSSSIVARREKRRRRKERVEACTGCGLEGFSKPSQLHAHLIQCAKRMEYQRIQEAIEKKKRMMKGL